MERNILVDLANQYRLENEHRGGVVLFFDGEVYGWKDKLRNPESERPGALAVDSEGWIYKATGGDDYNGAKEWVSI